MSLTSVEKNSWTRVQRTVTFSWEGQEISVLADVPRKYSKHMWSIIEYAREQIGSIVVSPVDFDEKGIAWKTVTLTHQSQRLEIRVAVRSEFANFYDPAVELAFELMDISVSH